jgi:hypothetical protein
LCIPQLPIIIGELILVDLDRGEISPYFSLTLIKSLDSHPLAPRFSVIFVGLSHPIPGKLPSALTL